ncbi:hypothetical protein V6768_12175 [Tistrella mobilis]
MTNNTHISACCKNYIEYRKNILAPAKEDLFNILHSNNFKLHQAVSFNFLIAHAIDYIKAIRESLDISESRIDFVRNFDKIFGIHGQRISNRKFELIDAINNAVKHIILDHRRYSDLRDKYGEISFRSLKESDGRIFCILDNYRFDYARVILRPAYDAILINAFEKEEDVIEYARGEHDCHLWSSDDEIMSSDDPCLAIDQMIIACNSPCTDCGELENDCYCAEFIYDGEDGYFESRFSAEFDFDTVMSRISGAYSPNK